MSAKSTLRSFFNSDTEMTHLIRSLPIIAGGVMIIFGEILAAVAAPDRMALVGEGALLIGGYVLFARWLNGRRRLGIGAGLRWLFEQTPQPVVVPTPTSLDYAALCEAVGQAKVRVPHRAA